MLQHSSLDDIEYSNYSQSTRLSIKNRQRSTRRRHSHHHKRRRNKNRNGSKFVIDTCAVCLDESSFSDTKLFPCGHSFHGQCLIQWVTSQKGRKFNCPLCRQDIAHFIQMTGNQELNDQLIQIWNEHYLYNQETTDITDDTTTTITEKDACCGDGLEKPSNCSKLDCCSTIKTITIESPKEQQQEIVEIIPNVEPIAQEDSVKIDPVTVPSKIEPVIEVNTVEPEIKVNKNQTETEDIVTSKSDHSIWKFIWKSPVSTLCKQKDGVFATFMMINSLLYPVYDTNVTYHDVDNVDYKQTDLLHPSYTKNKQSVHQQLFMEQQLHSSPCIEQQTEPQLHYEQITRHESTEFTKNDDHGSNNNDNNPYQYIDLLSSSILNFKSGVLAGLCAGTTTFLLTQQIRHEMVGQVNKLFINGSIRTSLIPILSETVPSVAVFFTSYEHLKKYLFNIDNINNTHSVTFAQRFISAGMASSLAYYLPNKQSPSKGLLPFRFAAFFGTFELCKDLMNKRHEELNLSQVALSATIGGTISHSLYHPLLQYKNIFVAGVDTVPWINLTTTTTATSSSTLAMKTIYRGWMSSLSKFLPSCVVCSCAFEYSKRYLSK